MSAEIEKPYRIDLSLMPDASQFPYVDIRQEYLSPKDPDPSYPEVATGELRVRQKVTPIGLETYSATVKFGKKSEGERTEIETTFDHGGFGTKPEDIANFGLGTVLKRRYFFPDKIEVDHYNEELHGKLWIAEREFKDKAESDLWVPPLWMTEDPNLPSNRQLAQIPASQLLNMARTRKDSLEHVALFIELLNKKFGAAIVTLSGMSGSGKSTVAQELSDLTGAPVINTDDFHIGAIALNERFGEVNHDLPQTYDYLSAADAARRLIFGNSVELPIYDFILAERIEEKRVLSPTDRKVVILEGLYAWNADYYPNVNAQGIPHFNILVDTPPYVCILRRILRESGIQEHDVTRETAWTQEESLRYIMEKAVPAFLEHNPKSDYFDAVL